MCSKVNGPNLPVIIHCDILFKCLNKFSLKVFNQNTLYFTDSTKRYNLNVYACFTKVFLLSGKA